MLSIVYGLGAMLGFGLSNAFSKIPAGKLKNLEFIFFRGLITSFMLGITLIFFLNETVFDWKYILITVLISIPGYASLLFFYKALNVGKVGIIAPIANSSSVYTILLAIILLGERLAINQLYAMAILFLGIILVSVDFKDLKNSKIFDKSSGMLYAIVTSLLWGFIFFAWRYPVAVLGPILTAFLVELIQTLYSLINIKYEGLKLNFSYSKKIRLYIVLVGLSGFIGMLSYNLGLSLGNISLVAAIFAANPLIATIYGAVFFKEKLNLQQYISVILIVVGVIGIAFLG